MALDPALVGGGFAIAGSLVTGLLQNWSQIRIDRRSAVAADAARVERLLDLRRETYLQYLQRADRAWDLVASLRQRSREQSAEGALALVGETAEVQREFAALESERQGLTLIGDLDTRREAIRLCEALTGLAFAHLESRRWLTRSSGCRTVCGLERGSTTSGVHDRCTRRNDGREDCQACCSEQVALMCTCGPLHSAGLQRPRDCIRARLVA